MKLKCSFYIVLSLCSIYILATCTSTIEEKYIIADGYTGFFGVLYQDNKSLERIRQGGFRVFHIPLNGVYESGFRFAEGAISQKFEFENGEKIEDLGFVQFGRLDINKSRYKIIDDNRSKVFAFYFYHSNVNGGENSFAIYLIVKGDDIIRLLKNHEKQFFYMSSYSFDWEENKEVMIKNIRRLNKELKERKAPFD